MSLIGLPTRYRECKISVILVLLVWITWQWVKRVGEIDGRPSVRAIVSAILQSNWKWWAIGMLAVGLFFTFYAPEGRHPGSWIRNGIVYVIAPALYLIFIKFVSLKIHREKAFQLVASGGSLASIAILITVTFS